MSSPKVSVSLITYNQERIVAQAIESAVGQETSFDYEVVIGEDASTDRTREIVLGYAARHPDRIRLVLQEENRGLVKNRLDTFLACRGEYVALLDGDDYWTSREKLAKQARFLDDHPECSIVFHDARVLLTDGSFCEANYTRPDHPPSTTIDQLFETNFIATCSVMLRRSAVPHIPDWYATSFLEDWPLYVLFADRGQIGYLAEPMGVYRFHERGLWSGLDPVARLERVVEFLGTMNQHYGDRHPSVRTSLARYVEELKLARAARAAV